MALLTPQSVTAAGAAITYAAASGGGDTVQGADDGRVALHVKNGSGGSINVTVTDPGRTPAGNTGTAVAVAVPAAGERLIALSPGTIDPATGLVSVTYSAVTSVTVAAVRR